MHLFVKYDEDGSGQLDIKEIRKLIFESDVRVVPKKCIAADEVTIQ